MQFDMGTRLASLAQSSNKPSVVFFVPYFGRWPCWFPAFATSCAYNPDFEWWLITDLEPQPAPKNVKFIPMSFEQFLQRARDILKCSIQKGPYSICDLRPAFGVIFSDLLEGVRFWGHADIDVVWGRLSIFLSEDQLNKYDIISSRRSAVAGHCTIYRNCSIVNTLFEDIPNYRVIMTIPRLCRMNESAMAQVLRTRRDVKVYWHAQHVVDQRELDRRPYSWRWESGHVLDLRYVERAYIHFASWKRSVQYVDFCYEDMPKFFRITPRGFFLKSEGTIADQLRLPPISSIYRRFYNWLRYVVTGRGRL